MQLQAVVAAGLFVEQYYPHCQAAILAGSAAEGTMRDQSDLDLIIFDNGEQVPFKQTYELFGWPIEMFLLNESSYPTLFEVSRQQGTGALIRMCAHGILLKDDGAGTALRQNALLAWQAGPPSWTLDDMNKARFEITEEIIDMEGSALGDESIFAAFKLIQSAIKFYLRVNDQWTGEGKWLFRTFKRYDPATAEGFIKALQLYFKHDDKQPLISFIEQLLEPYGGRLHTGHREIGLAE